MILPALVALAAAWAAGLLSEGLALPFPTLFGTRAPVPLSLLAAIVGLILVVYGLDRARAPEEAAAYRPVRRWDAVWAVAVILAAVVAGAVSHTAGNTEGPAMARAAMAGLGGYLVARSFVRPDLAGLVPLGLLTANAALWDVRVSAGPWLFAAPDTPGAWAAAAVLFALGLALLVRR
jgi:hypothetical protein